MIEKNSGGGAAAAALLLQNGANVNNATDNFGVGLGMSPLHVAARWKMFKANEGPEFA